MKRLVLVGVAALTFGAMGCSSDSNSSGTGGAAAASGGSTGSSDVGGSSAVGGSTGTGTGAQTGGTTGAGTTAAAQTGGTTGASTTAATGGSSSAGGDTSAGGTAACGTTNGTYTETTTFASALTPYALNSWSWTPAAIPTLTLTTTGPSGIDCSTGCAKLSANYVDGVGAYAAAVMVEYFGTTATAVTNLYGETITVQLAAVVTPASGATAPDLSFDLFGQDLDTTVNANLWTKSLGSAATLATGFQTVTYTVANTPAPSWAPTRTVCGDQLHQIGIRVQNNAAITTANAATVDVYVKSVSVAP